MTWLPEQTSGEYEFDRVFGLCPALFEAWRAFESLLWTRPGVDPAILELCRLRIAQMHGLRLDSRARPRAAEPDLPRAASARESDLARESDPGPTERACLRFAEQWVLDAKGITDADAAAVTSALGDAGTVAFVEALAVFDGFARFRRILDIEDPA